MDFSYENGTGPIDARSPFAQLSQNAQRFPPTPSQTNTNTKKSRWTNMTCAMFVH